MSEEITVKKTTIIELKDIAYKTRQKILKIPTKGINGDMVESRTGIDKMLKIIGGILNDVNK